MSPGSVAAQRAATRRALSWILAGALCVAALIAIGAILNGRFDETDGRAIATSLGFAVFSATGAAGAGLRLRPGGNLRSLGQATIACSAAAFMLLLAALWIDRSNGEALWEWWGAATLAAFACSHAALMGGSFRPTDSPAVRSLGVTSIALAVVDSSIGILAIAGAFDRIEAGWAQLVGVLVVLLLLTTALTPILRRLQRATATVAAAATPAPFATEVIASADRLEALNADPGNCAPEIRREIERLRALAQSYSR
jgi:hypothetical protein